MAAGLACNFRSLRQKDLRSKASVGNTVRAQTKSMIMGGGWRRREGEKEKERAMILDREQLRKPLSPLMPMISSLLGAPLQFP